MTPQLRFSEFTDEWQVKSLSKFSDFQEGPGIMAVDFKEKGVPLIRLSGLAGPAVSLDGCNYLDIEKVVKKWDHFRLKIGDMLLSSSASLGVVSEVGKEAEGSIAYTGIIRFRALENEATSGFLKQILISNNFQNQASSMSTGATIHHFGPTHLKQMSFPIPAKPEQEKIADYMEGIDSKLTSIQTKVAAMHEYKKGVMQALFSGKLRFKDENGHSFPDWEEKKLGDILEFARNGLSIDQNTKGVGYAVTRIETISNNNIDMNKVGFVDTQTDISDYKLLSGDLLFSNINSPTQIGRTVYIDKDLDVYHGMNLLRLRVQKDKVDAKYVYYVLSSSKYKRHFERICNKAVNQASINQTDLKRTVMRIPSLQEQQKIANFLAILDDKIKLKEAKLASTKEFKKALLQRMFV